MPRYFILIFIALDLDMHGEINYFRVKKLTTMEMTSDVKYFYEIEIFLSIM